MSSERNGIARLQNRMLHSAEEVLAPLYNAENNTIDQFPPNPRAIQNMGGMCNPSKNNLRFSLMRCVGRSLDTVLRALGSETDGNVDKKRLKLRLLVGLRTDIP